MLANGYSVLEPIAPEPYDLAVKRAGEPAKFVQVKTAFLRDEERYGGEYLVVRGVRSNGDVYTLDEVDMFAAIWDGEVYVFPNREKCEYWVKPELLSEKWTKLEWRL